MQMPKYGEVYKCVLQALEGCDLVSNKDLCDVIAKRLGMSDELRAIAYASNRKNIFDSRVMWARTYLKTAGLLEVPASGFSRITEEGKKVLAENPYVLNNAYLSRYDSFRAFMKGQAAYMDADVVLRTNESMDDTPEERIDAAFSQINAALRGEILVEVMRLSPSFFERLVVTLLEKMGYGGMLEGAGTVTQPSNDGGIDGILKEDKLGFSNIYIQAKRYAHDKTVGRPEIQTFIGAIANKSGKGLFVTTGTFTDRAKHCAKENHIVLIDGDRLAELMIEYGVGVSTVRNYKMKQLDTDFFKE